jgi:hypothetical protein
MQTLVHHPLASAPHAPDQLSPSPSIPYFTRVGARRKPAGKPPKFSSGRTEFFSHPSFLIFVRLPRKLSAQKAIRHLLNLRFKR